MKIALYHNLPNGGAKKVVYNQIKILTRKHTVDLYQIEAKGKDFLDFEGLNCNIITFSDKEHSSRLLRDLYQYTEYKLLQQKIARQIDTQGYDLVIVHPDQVTQAPFLLRYLKTKAIYYCEEMLRMVYEPQFGIDPALSLHKKIYEKTQRMYRKKIDQDNLKAAKIVVANSKYTQQNIFKATGIKAEVVYPGVDRSVYYPRPTKKIYDILFVGERSKLEGYDLLFEAFKLFEHKPKLEVVSRRESGAWISEEQMSKYYCQTKIVVALSLREPFGLIPIEAMSCGVPVVGVSEGGIAETVVDKKSGFLIKRDVRILYERLSYLLGQEEIRDEMGKFGVKLVKENFTIEDNIENILALI